MPVFFFKLPRSKVLLLGISAGALALALGVLWMWYAGGRISDDQARVEGRLQLLAAGVPGRVAAVYVTDNQLVKNGEELIRLEDGVLEVALAEARARLEALRQGVSAAFADPVGDEPSSVRSAEQALLAGIETARNNEVGARREFEHLTTLHAQTLLEVRRLDALPGGRRPGVDQRNKARLAEIEARGNMEDARDRLSAMSRARAATEADLRRFRAEMSRRGRGALPDDLRARQIELETARVREAEQNLAASVLRAATDGRVERLSALPGMDVRKGQLLGVVVPTQPENLWIEIRVPESRAAEVEPGMACEIVVPAVPERTFKGMVTSVVPGSFNVPDAAAEEQAPPTSGVPFHVALMGEDGGNSELALKIGMRAKVTVLTRATRIAMPPALRPES